DLPGRLSRFFLTTVKTQVCDRGLKPPATPGVPMADLNGRKALVTGAAQGLGEGMARGLAAAGATVVVADLQQDLGAKVAESLGAGHGFVPLDVTDDAGW